MATSPITCRVATAQDIPGILALQETCYIDNLSPEQRNSGFLSVRFTAAQFGNMLNEVGIVVAAGGDGAIVGYLCASTVDDGHSSPILARMFELFDVVQYRHKSLSARRLFLYGPVCIHEAHRGRGILPALYDLLKQQMAGRFDTGVAFVAKINARSLRAHIDKLSMTELCEFKVEEAGYVLLAFDVPAC